MFHQSEFSGAVALVWVMTWALVAACAAWPNDTVSPGWRPHFIRVGDGNGGWTLKHAQCQILRYREYGWTAGFGVAQMDNGEIIVLGICDPGKSLWYGGGEGEITVAAFSSDGGDTWTDLEGVDGLTGRPVMLTYLGGGNLSVITGGRRFSSDYGRTWPESVPVPPAANGAFFGVEGNPLVDRDESGEATRIAEIGYNFGPEGSYQAAEPTHAFIRWSADGGRTWTDESEPMAWRRQDTYEGQTYERGVSEGSLVRADNGRLVAALRTDMPARYVEGVHSDQMEGTGISISRDDGQTWSPVETLFDAGRMHGHLLKMPDGDLVLTVTVRHDVADGELASYRRGCEAVVSHDSGLTWDLDRRYVLDEWEFHDSAFPAIGQCGHLYATVLDDGSILTVHNNYLTMGMTLIRWRP